MSQNETEYCETTSPTFPKQPNIFYIPLSAEGAISPDPVHTPGCGRIPWAWALHWPAQPVPGHTVSVPLTLNQKLLKISRTWGHPKK